MNSAAPAVLVFPVTTPDAREFLAQCQREGRRALAAGITAEPPPGVRDVAYRQLPSIHADSFPGAFEALVEAEGVGAVYAAVASVHAGLVRLIATGKTSVRLVNDPPIRRQVRLLDEREALAASLRPLERAIADGLPGLGEIELLAYFAATMGIYGESGPTKLAALAGIAASAVKGDVVEIGCLMGRSTAALRLLARHFGIGPVITVDPWSRVHALQTETPAVVQVDMIDQWDYDQLARAFFTHQMALGTTDFAHMRMPSADGFDRYAAAETLDTPGFHPVQPGGRIALLHIDGNHDFVECARDWSMWGRYLGAGSWLILDDYVWAHGDGPRRVGDALLRAEADRIDRAFVCDQALFVRFTDRPMIEPIVP